MSVLSGLTQKQVRILQQIIAAVRLKGLPARAAVICVETVLVESGIHIYANQNVPGSINVSDNDGYPPYGPDHLSVGLYQQQVPMWGTAADCMNPVTATGKFLAKLVSFNWQAMPTGAAAQRVQVSAFPDRYQEKESVALAIVTELWATQPKDTDMYIVHRADVPTDKPEMGVLVGVGTAVILSEAAEAAYRDLGVTVESKSPATYGYFRTLANGKVV